jgi:hypothetical protein
MDVILYRKLHEHATKMFGYNHRSIAHVEIPVVAPDDLQYSVLVIDAEDSFDIAIQEPDGRREIIWSMCRDPQEYIEYTGEDGDD